MFYRSFGKNVKSFINKNQMTLVTSEKQHSATFRVQNIVASGQLHREISLEKITAAYKDAEENRNRFPGICLRFKKPKSTILLFKNGKIVITGLRYSKDAPVVVERLIERLNAIGIEILEEPTLDIVNVVVSLDMKKTIDLDDASLLLHSSIYEPEVFPGLIFRIPKPKAVFLIFSSGKVVLTGLKSESQIIPAIKLLGKTLKDLGLLKGKSD